MGVPEFFYFDLGNVLFHFDHGLACRQAGQLVGLPAEAVRDILFTADVQQRYERGDFDSAAMYRLFCERSGRRPDYEALLRATSAIFSLNREVVPILSGMRAAGLRLGILSNTCAAHWEYLNNGRYTVLGSLFELAVLSFEVRCLKPEAAIYAHATRRAGVAAARIFFVDDRPENIAGARQAGWQAVQYQSPRQLAADLRRLGVEFKLPG